MCCPASFLGVLGVLWYGLSPCVCACGRGVCTRVVRVLLVCDPFRRVFFRRLPLLSDDWN